MNVNAMNGIPMSPMDQTAFNNYRKKFGTPSDPAPFRWSDLVTEAATNLNARDFRNLVDGRSASDLHLNAEGRPIITSPSNLLHANTVYDNIVRNAGMEKVWASARLQPMKEAYDAAKASGNTREMAIIASQIGPYYMQAVDPELPISSTQVGTIRMNEQLNSQFGVPSGQALASRISTETSEASQAAARAAEMSANLGNYYEDAQAAFEGEAPIESVSDESLDGLYELLSRGYEGSTGRQAPELSTREEKIDWISDIYEHGADGYTVQRLLVDGKYYTSNKDIPFTNALSAYHQQQADFLTGVQSSDQLAERAEALLAINPRYGEYMDNENGDEFPTL